MAKWAKPAYRDVPVGLLEYRPEHWGPDDGGIRSWRRAAVEWLDEDKLRRLPAGDVLGVFRESLRLMGASGPDRRRRGIS